MDEDQIQVVKVEVLDSILRAYGVYRYESLARAKQGIEDGYYKLCEEAQAGGVKEG